MKKILITLVSILTMNAAQAQDTSPEVVNETGVFSGEGFSCIAQSPKGIPYALSRPQQERINGPIVYSLRTYNDVYFIKLNVKGSNLTAELNDGVWNGWRKSTLSFDASSAVADGQIFRYQSLNFELVCAQNKGSL